MDGSLGHGEGRFPESLTQRWMHMRGAGQVFAARAERYRNGRFVDQITGMRAQNMNAQNTICFCVSQDFYHALDLSQGPGAAICPEWKSSLAVLFPGFL